MGNITTYAAVAFLDLSAWLQLCKDDGFLQQQLPKFSTTLNMWPEKIFQAFHVSVVFGLIGWIALSYQWCLVKGLLQHGHWFVGGVCGFGCTVFMGLLLCNYIHCLTSDPGYVNAHWEHDAVARHKLSGRLLSSLEVPIQEVLHTNGQSGRDPDPLPFHRHMILEYKRNGKVRYCRKVWTFQHACGGGDWALGSGGRA